MRDFNTRKWYKNHVNKREIVLSESNRTSYVLRKLQQLAKQTLTKNVRTRFK